MTHPAKQRLAALLLALALLASLTAPAAAETASVIRLTKTTGTVEISKSSGKSVSLLKNMRLYNGYHVETSEESYAWINLDDSKLLKEDAGSEVEVRKDGKKLEVLLSSGNLFFDVAEPLEDDESMNIRTSTTVVGIRGTSGWMEVVDRWTTRISVLEGEVECSVADPVTGQIKSEKVRGGETALCVVYPQERTGDKSDILRDKYTVEKIPGYILTELVQNIPLCDIIAEETGLDIPRDLASVAGGDPSGRTPDRENATPEVLGEADRREDEDEEALRKKLEALEKEQAKQEHTVSGDKAVPKPAPSAPSNSDSGGSSGGGSGSSSGSSGNTPEQSRGMKLKDVEVQALLNAESAVSIAPNTDASDTTPKKNTLEVDTGLTVTSGKTLTFQPGIDMEVYPGKVLQVDGTLTADNLQNNGTTVVTSGDTLRLRGNLITAGTLNVTATGRVVVDGTFSRSGTLSLASGAAVLAKTFAPGAAPSGWEVSSGTDANGYYTLIPSGTVTPPGTAGCSVTFDANGGVWDAGTAQTVLQTDETGRVPAWPADPANSALSPHFSYPFIFGGWYTAAVGGDKIESDHVFAGDTRLYAHWTVSGVEWEYLASSKTIRIYGTGPTGDYPIQYSSAGQASSTAPWASDLGQAETAVIEDGITAIGGGALATAYGDVQPMELKSVVIPNSVTSIGKEAFFFCSITSITIPDSVTSIGDYAFAFCSALTSAEIPNSVTSIGAFAFEDCSSLSSVTIPSSVTSIESYAFSRCSSLSSVTIQNGVTSIGRYAFMQCSSLTSVTIPSSVTSIGDSAFYDCGGLTSVTIPFGVTSIKPSTFWGCGRLTSVTIPSSVTSIGNNAFDGCQSLTSVTIPSGVTSIGTSAFDGCASLTSVTIPSGVASIESSAFSGCTGLTSVTIQDGVTSIGTSAFSYCTSLTSLSIPASVTSIGDNAFANSTSMTAVDFAGTRTEWGVVVKGTNALPASVATIRCKDGDITL